MPEHGARTVVVLPQPTQDALQEDPRETLLALEHLRDTMSRWLLTFSQLEEHARHSVSRAQLACASVTDEVSHTQVMAQEHLDAAARGVADAAQIRTEATDALAAAQKASRYGQSIQTQARQAVGRWTAALEHACLRLDSGRFEQSQAEEALKLAKTALAASEKEHTAALAHGGGARRPPVSPLAAARAQHAAGRREHARMQVRFALLRTTSAREAVTAAQALVERCKGGVARAHELLRAAQESIDHAAAAQTLAQEGVSLAEAAGTQAGHGQSAAGQAAGHVVEAASAASALSAVVEVARSGAQEVTEGLDAHRTLQGPALIALERVYNHLLPQAPR